MNSDETILIQLSKTGKHKGKYKAIVSIEDSDLAELNWQANPRKDTTYVYRKSGKEYLHRIIMKRVLGRDLDKSEHIDHINGNGLDNRRCNLRVATRYQNLQNRSKADNNTSGYKGAYWRKDRSRWYSQIIVNGKKIYLGSFDTAKEAHKAYCEAAKDLHGEFYNGDNG